MSPKQYRDTLTRLDLTQTAAASVLGIDARTSRRWAKRGVPHGPAVILLRLLLMKKVSASDIFDAIRYRPI
jgi:DNA-binding transcriptional regulator YiaG